MCVGVLVICVLVFTVFCVGLLFVCIVYLCIFIFIYFLFTSVRTTATEWQLIFSNNNNNNNNWTKNTGMNMYQNQ